MKDLIPASELYESRDFSIKFNIILKEAIFSIAFSEIDFFGGFVFKPTRYPNVIVLLLFRSTETKQNRFAQSLTEEGIVQTPLQFVSLPDNGTKSLRNLIWKNTWFKRIKITAIRVHVKLDIPFVTIDNVRFVQTGLEDDGSERRRDGTHRRTTRLQERPGQTRQDQTAAGRPARSTGGYSCVLGENELQRRSKCSPVQ